MAAVKSIGNISLYHHMTPQHHCGGLSSRQSSKTVSTNSGGLTIEYVTKSNLKIPTKKLLTSSMSYDNDLQDLIEHSPKLNTKSTLMANVHASASHGKSHTTLDYYYNNSTTPGATPTPNARFKMQLKSSLQNKKELRAVLNEKQKKLADKFIDKDDCKNYLTNLRFNDYLEKQNVLKVSEGLSNQNRSKFDYYMRNVDEVAEKQQQQQHSTSAMDNLRLVSSLRTYNEFKDFKQKTSTTKAFLKTSPTPVPQSTSPDYYSHNESPKYMNRHLLPNLLNQIRLTNFSSEYNGKKEAERDRERERKTYRKDISTVMGYYENDRVVRTPNLIQENEQLNISFYLPNDEVTEVNIVTPTPVEKPADSRAGSISNSKEFLENSNLSKRLGTPANNLTTNAVVPTTPLLISSLVAGGLEENRPNLFSHRSHRSSIKSDKERIIDSALGLAITCEDGQNVNEDVFESNSKAASKKGSINGDVKPVEPVTDDDDTITISSLNSEQRTYYKSRWPTEEEIEKLLGIKFKKPEPVKQHIEVEVKSETESIGEKSKGKSKKSASNISRSKKSASARSQSQKSASARKTITGRTPSAKRSAGTKSPTAKKSLAPSSRSPSASSRKTGAKKVAGKSKPAIPAIIDATSYDERLNEQANTINDQPPPESHLIIPVIHIEDVEKVEQPVAEPKLPEPMCPSSIEFSKKLGVRLWLQNNNFNNGVRTVPLV